MTIVIVEINRSASRKMAQHHHKLLILLKLIAIFLCVGKSAEGKTNFLSFKHFNSVRTEKPTPYLLYFQSKSVKLMEILIVNLTNSRLARMDVQIVFAQEVKFNAM